jgi:hypothetical protein
MKKIFLLILSFALIGFGAYEAKAVEKYNITMLRSAAIKLVVDFDKSQADSVFWNESDVIKSINSSKISDYKVLSYGVEVKLAGGIIAGVNTMVIPLNYLSKNYNDSFSAKVIKGEIDRKISKFVAIEYGKRTTFKGKSYQSFNLIPALPFTDTALGFLENNKVIDIGTAEVGCYTLDKSLIKFYQLDC